MADAQEVQDVLGMLGPIAPTEGWTAEKIAAMLDAGDRPTEIARQYWESRMASTANLVDVAESGSSRKMSQITDNAAKLAAYWGSVDAGLNPATAPGAISRPIRRV